MRRRATQLSLGSMTDPDGASSAERTLQAAKATEDSASRELARELEYRNRLEGRSGTIATTTGGLVTAVGAIITFSPRPADFRFPTAALVAVAVSLIFFLASIAARSGKRSGKPKTCLPDSRNQSADSSLDQGSSNCSDVRCYGIDFGSVGAAARRDRRWLIARVGVA